MNKELKALSEWFIANKMNIKKSNYMIVNKGCHDNENDYILYFDNEMLHNVEETKFLGLTIDNQLQWNAQLRILK